jgi:hypothetical protein
MMIILSIVAIAAAIYIYAAFAYYYGFKNWYPLCGCKGTRSQKTIGGWKLEDYSKNQMRSDLKDNLSCEMLTQA